MECVLHSLLTLGMFPSRLTASEPNLLKVRLKQRVIERRASPMARRQDRLLKHRSPSKLAHHHSVALRTVASMHPSHIFRRTRRIDILSMPLQNTISIQPSSLKTSIYIIYICLNLIHA